MSIEEKILERQKLRKELSEKTKEELVDLVIDYQSHNKTLMSRAKKLKQKIADKHNDMVDDHKSTSVYKHDCTNLLRGYCEDLTNIIQH